MCLKPAGSALGLGPPLQPPSPCESASRCKPSVLRSSPSRGAAAGWALLSIAMGNQGLDLQLRQICLVLQTEPWLPH